MQCVIHAMILDPSYNCSPVSTLSLQVSIANTHHLPARCAKAIDVLPFQALRSAEDHRIHQTRDSQHAADDGACPAC